MAAPKAAPQKERNKNESILHQLLFPMRKDSLEVQDHDIWLLNEEYQYFSYIASDKPLSSFRNDDNETMFAPDIDDALKSVLERNYLSNQTKRPDIAIFSREGAAIIIELKAPGVMLDDHLNDLMEYAQLLAAKSGGKLKKFYGYLLGTDLNRNRLRGYQQFPSGQGWFGTEEVTEHQSNTRLGELYSEILYSNDILARAQKRLDIYRKKLNLDVGYKE